MTRRRPDPPDIRSPTCESDSAAETSYRGVTDMLGIEGWGVNHKFLERIWRSGWEAEATHSAAAEARSAVAQLTGSCRGPV